ncbi:hypothetical protein M0812_01525 [Anaeramoeba flamelloides]|uniref:Uncharacterized protein n=2 Tax=Anaeramoeba flamelloides TaxID=1746091 RepID=A0AAV8A7T7_9EUKA|nr:hypothetical protein M0812_01525 [Anaeramoeba flamelloides]
MISIQILIKQDVTLLFQLFGYSYFETHLFNTMEFNILYLNNIKQIKTLKDLENDGLLFLKKNDENTSVIIFPYIYLDLILEKINKTNSLYLPRILETPTKTKNFSINEKDDLKNFLLRLQLFSFLEPKEPNVSMEAMGTKGTKKEKKIESIQTTFISLQKIFYSPQYFQKINNKTKNNENFENNLLFCSEMKFNIEFNKIKSFELKSKSNLKFNNNNNNSFCNTGQIISSNFNNKIIQKKLFKVGIGFLNVANSPFADSFLVLPINEDYQEMALEKWIWQRKQISKTHRFNSGMDKLKNGTF